MSGAQVARQKAAALLALSNEFLRQAPNEAEGLISRELRNAVGAGVDAAVMATLFAGVAAHTSTGSPIADARMLLQDVGLTAMSRPFWVAGVNVAIDIGRRPPRPPVGPGGGDWNAIYSLEFAMRAVRVPDQASDALENY